MEVSKVPSSTSQGGEGSFNGSKFQVVPHKDVVEVSKRFQVLSTSQGGGGVEGSKRFQVPSSTSQGGGGSFKGSK